MMSVFISYLSVKTRELPLPKLFAKLKVLREELPASYLAVAVFSKSTGSNRSSYGSKFLDIDCGVNVPIMDISTIRTVPLSNILS